MGVADELSKEVGYYKDTVPAEDINVNSMDRSCMAFPKNNYGLHRSMVKHLIFLIFY